MLRQFSSYYANSANQKKPFITARILLACVCVAASMGHELFAVKSVQAQPPNTPTFAGPIPDPISQYGDTQVATGIFHGYDQYGKFVTTLYYWNSGWPPTGLGIAYWVPVYNVIRGNKLFTPAPLFELRTGRVVIAYDPTLPSHAGTLDLTMIVGMKTFPYEGDDGPMTGFALSELPDLSEKRFIGHSGTEYYAHNHFTTTVGEFLVNYDHLNMGATLAESDPNRWIHVFETTMPAWDFVGDPLPAILSSHVYHSDFTGSGTDWAAIDNTKVPLKRPPHRNTVDATIDNMVNSAAGITGVVFDVQGLPNTLSVNDFAFRWSPQGAFDDNLPKDEWQLAPQPVSIETFDGSPNRVLMQWNSGTILNRWLRITIKANENTGLEQEENYYLGHLLGEMSASSTQSYDVNFSDLAEIRGQAGNEADASNAADIDKNGMVNFSDVMAARSNVGTQLTNIHVAD